MTEKNRRTSLTILEVSWDAWLRCSNRYTQGVAASAGVLLLDSLASNQREMLTDMIKGTIPFDRSRLRELAADAFLTLAEVNKQNHDRNSAESRKSG